MIDFGIDTVQYTLQYARAQEQYFCFSCLKPYIREERRADGDCRGNDGHHIYRVHDEETTTKLR